MPSRRSRAASDAPDSSDAPAPAIKKPRALPHCKKCPGFPLKKGCGCTRQGAKEKKRVINAETRDRANAELLAYGLPAAVPATPHPLAAPRPLVHFTPPNLRQRLTKITIDFVTDKITAADAHDQLNLALEGHHHAGAQTWHTYIDALSVPSPSGPLVDAHAWPAAAPDLLPPLPPLATSSAGPIQSPYAAPTLDTAPDNGLASLTGTTTTQASSSTSAAPVDLNLLAASLWATPELPVLASVLGPPPPRLPTPSDAGTPAHDEPSDGEAEGEGG